MILPLPGLIVNLYGENLWWSKLDPACVRSSAKHFIENITFVLKNIDFGFDF